MFVLNNMHNNQAYSYDYISKYFLLDEDAYQHLSQN